MAITYVPDEHQILRAVPPSKYARDDDGGFLGFFFSAFELRSDEDNLSTTWAEHCSDGKSKNCVADAVRKIRLSNFKPRPSTAFAVGCVERIKSAGELSSRRLRIIHEPEDDNDSHAAVRGYSNADRQLLETLARDAWSHCVMNRDVPAA